MHIILLSFYELGHQPFGLASPVAWLKAAGAKVDCLDLAVQQLDDRLIRQADLIGFYVPMHTATRIAISFMSRIQALNPTAHLCFYGLYAPVNESRLRQVGADTILGGEFEEGLVALYHRLSSQQSTGENLLSASGNPQPEPTISLAKQRFQTPDRKGLPALDKYAYLNLGNGNRRVVGYTEASRGCKHLCRHCPIVPVYGGHFRIVQRNVVLADIRAQVEAGACHITFGDPDFLNGPGHAFALLESLHEEFPQLTYDVTIKVEHLLKHADALSLLHKTGCLFVTSAVEAVDDEILAYFDKGHTRADFIQVVSLFRDNDLVLSPTFVAFNPWIMPKGYLELLHLIADLQLIDHVAPIQYAIRLLIPAGSRLLELPDVQNWIDAFDEKALVYPWHHPEPLMDQLHEDVLMLIQQSEAKGYTRQKIFDKIWSLAEEVYIASLSPSRPKRNLHQGVVHKGNAQWSLKRPTCNPAIAKPIPHLSEPWYC